MTTTLMSRVGSSWSPNSSRSMLCRACYGTPLVRLTLLYADKLLSLNFSHILISGCTKLARIEEDIVTAFSEVGGDDNTRLTVTLNRAYHVRPCSRLTA